MNIQVIPSFLAWSKNEAKRSR